MKIITLMEDTKGKNSCIYEHGLSIYIETKKHNILVDTGASNNFIQNAKKLGIDLTNIDIVILSHGHYDHSGGLLSFCEINNKAKIYMRKEATEAFYHGERYIGIDPDISKLSNVVLVDQDLEIEKGLSLFGQIHGRRYFAKSNLLLSKQINGKKIQDDFIHEQCVVIEEDGKRILISGCAHNGILNIMDRFMEIYGEEPNIVISGFHMMKKGEYDLEETNNILDTAEELCQYKTIFYTGHCTGQKAIDLMKPVMGDQLVQIHSGSEILWN